MSGIGWRRLEPGTYVLGPGAAFPACIHRNHLGRWVWHDHASGKHGWCETLADAKLAVHRGRFGSLRLDNA